MIVKDREKRIPGSNLKLIKYGDNSWEPSFWPNDMLQWTSIKKNISNLRKGDFPGPHSTLDVLREAVRRGLVANGLDPENYYDPEKFTTDLQKKRKRNRGIHVRDVSVDEDVEDIEPEPEQEHHLQPIFSQEDQTMPEDRSAVLRKTFIWMDFLRKNGWLRMKVALFLTLTLVPMMLMGRDTHIWYLS